MTLRRSCLHLCRDGIHVGIIWYQTILPNSPDALKDAVTMSNRLSCDAQVLSSTLLERRPRELVPDFRLAMITSYDQHCWAGTKDARLPPQIDHLGLLTGYHCTGSVEARNVIRLDTSKEKVRVWEKVDETGTEDKSHFTRRPPHGPIQPSRRAFNLYMISHGMYNHSRCCGWCCPRVVQVTA